MAFRQMAWDNQVLTPVASVIAVIVFLQHV